MVWKLHCDDIEARKKYSTAMLSVATKVWNKQHPNDTRIEWCYHKWSWYYFGPGFAKFLTKDYRRTYGSLKSAAIDGVRGLESFERTEKVKVLDVGSCYNPFAKYTNCDCIAIDLTPATKDVYQCDFLNLRIKTATDCQSKLGASFLPNPVKTLPEQSFEVVVFSLLLEYFPSTAQRWMCCEKARLLLKKYGLLLIVTPDSKNVNKNAPMMKNWKEALQILGFERIVYEKQKHLHCLAFRKLNSDRNAILDAKHGLLAIPQDSKLVQDDDDGIEIYERTEEEEDNIANCFTQLPFS